MTSRLAAAALAALAAATVGAFFITQRLKQAPAVVQAVSLTHVFSPNGDGRLDTARLSFRLKRADDVSVKILDEQGDVVRTLLENRAVPARGRVRLRWGGLTDARTVAPDGLYRFRVNLRHEGRSVTVPRAVRLDVTPPHPVVTSVFPDIIPARGSGVVRVRYRGARRVAARFRVYATDSSPAREVAHFSGRAGSSVALWDARLAEGRPARAGTYLIAVLARDRAGNLGSGPAVLPPRPGSVEGHPGITVRFLAVQPPAAPVPAGAATTFFVDARGRPYDWAVRRVGARRPLKRGSKRSVALSLHAPTGPSGVYVLKVRRDDHVARVPFAVQARRTANVLLVLPWATWQGSNPVDPPDQDGIPNTLDTGEPVRVLRPFSALPTGFGERTAPLLAYLDRAGLRYDVATDLDLAGPRGAALLSGRPGVMVAGDARWLPLAAGRRLRRFVEDGGNLASVGIDSLRRQVALARGGAVLERPTAPAARDIFGSALAPIVRRPVDLLNFGEDRVALFAGTGGGFPGFHAYEATRSVQGGRIVSAAGPAAGMPVVVAVRLGRGLVVRYGLPELPRRLARDADVAALVRRTWTLLSR